jgi:hypothetical protein
VKIKMNSFSFLEMLNTEETFSDVDYLMDEKDDMNTLNSNETEIILPQNFTQYPINTQMDKDSIETLNYFNDIDYLVDDVTLKTNETEILQNITNPKKNSKKNSTKPNITKKSFVDTPAGKSHNKIVESAGELQEYLRVFFKIKKTPRTELYGIALQTIKSTKSENLRLKEENLKLKIEIESLKNKK